MVVDATHTTDWQWQAVLDQMEELRRKTYIDKLKQDPAGSTYWTISAKGEHHLRALELFEAAGAEVLPEMLPSVTTLPGITSGQVTTAPTQPTTGVAPPVISKVFGALRIALNGTTSLTFTISNPNLQAKLTNVGFSDNFPTGLVISTPNGLIGDYGGGIITAAGGSKSIILSRASLEPGSSFQFTVNVTGITAGGIINTTGEVYSSEGGSGNAASAPLGVMEATAEGPQSATEKMGASEWLGPDLIERFSPAARWVLQRADHLRSTRKTAVLTTLHLLIAFAEQPDGQLAHLLKQAGVPNMLASLTSGDVEAEDPPQEIPLLSPWKFPPVTHNVRLALINARNKADEVSSAIIDDSHLLFGVLSLTETDNSLVKGLHLQGITSDKVTLHTKGIPIAMGSQIGPATHVARDRWTLDDALGYFPYAYAIYRFLIDKGTQSPLSISIQAPWGGGKTSMMRMIQAQLDPKATQILEKSQSPGEQAATVQDVVSEMERPVDEASATSASASKLKIDPMHEPGETRATVWFNAWKYESTSQVWAGLADAIIKQITDRLTWRQREIFWFRLQLRRIDASKVRGKIHAEITSRFIEKIIPALWRYLLALGTGALAMLVGWLPIPSSLKYLGPFGAFLIILRCIQSAAKRWSDTKSEVDKQPAKLTLGEFVTAPDYGANLGFIHYVVEDLKAALELIPNNDRPVVIFIDDLDRCSPNKVADVIEAINLFLAGEFPYCIFVLGIDDEMVAAALDKAHADVISRLPPYARSASIGWRFMDKFVQLPFIVPPPTPSDRSKYAESLLTQARSGSIDMRVRTQAARAIETKVPSRPPDEIAREVADKSNLTPAQHEELKEEIQIIDQMDQNIKSFSDNEERIRTLILGATKTFSINPRDVKRFVNVFRFYYFLRAAREARNEPVPSLPQLTRWMTLSLKWPGIVRWLRRGYFEADKGAATQLKELETVGNECSDLSDWKEKAAAVFGIEVKDAMWLADREMMDFFREEAKLKESDRLSSSSDKGLW